MTNDVRFLDLPVKATRLNWLKENANELARGTEEVGSPGVDLASSSAW